MISFKEGGNIMWIIFVLNFDATYNNIDAAEIGVPPAVYIVPKDKIKDVKKCAKQAQKDFWYDDNTSDLTLSEYFENHLDDENIDFSVIGSIELPFGKRKGDYLDKHIITERV